MFGCHESLQNTDICPDAAVNTERSAYQFHGLLYSSQAGYVSLFPRVHNVQCTSELQVRVPGQSQAGQGGEEGAEGEGEGGHQHPSSGQKISLSLPTAEANKVESVFPFQIYEPCVIRIVLDLMNEFRGASFMFS